jgi:patatin-like phospholipase/acyl hydrolase
MFEDDYYARVHENKIKYNILSVDAGGVRGIVPAVWLNEIENRTRRPISHMFNMMSGTSTGINYVLFI